MALLKKYRLARGIGGSFLIMGMAMISCIFLILNYGGDTAGNAAYNYKMKIPAKLLGTAPFLIIWGLVMVIFPGKALPVEPDNMNGMKEIKNMIAGLSIFEKSLWICAPVIGLAAGFFLIFY